MPMTLGGSTGVTFNDATTQSTAFSNAAGTAIGSLVFATHESSTTPINYGDSIAGSLLYPTSAAGSLTSALTGTWRCLGSATTASRQSRSTLWVRIA